MDLVIFLGIGLAVGAVFGLLLGRAPVAELRRQLGESRERRDSDHAVLEALAPVRETLTHMQSKVVDLERQRATQHGELAAQLRTTQATAEQSRQAAESLASAMANTSVRGVWGETQLRTLVESAGLINRVDFLVQESIEAESGARRPDMIVRLPGAKSIAVDAKVPVNAYLEASALSGSDVDIVDRRSQLLGRHAKHVRAHVDELSARQYWSGLMTSPEFTVAFIPSESVLAAALEADPGLMEYAFSRRVALVSPVSLWSVLKTVAFTWQQEALTEDAKELFDLGRQLHERLGTMGDHVERLRRSLAATVDNYNKFASSLESRVLVTARRFNALDESKVLGTPGLVDADPRTLVQPEFGPDS